MYIYSNFLNFDSTQCILMSVKMALMEFKCIWNILIDNKSLIGVINLFIWRCWWYSTQCTGNNKKNHSCRVIMNRRTKFWIQGVNIGCFHLILFAFFMCVNTWCHVLIRNKHIGRLTIIIYQNTIFVFVWYPIDTIQCV